MKYKLVLEQPKWTRVLHWVFVFILTVKVFTGLYIAYPSSANSFKFIRMGHFYLAYFLLFWFLARIYFAMFTGDYKNFIPNRFDLKNIPQFLKYELFLTKKKPPQGKYNVGQKFVFLSWLLIIIFQLITGFALYDPTLGKPLDLLMGGINYLRWYHYLAALYLATTIPLHVYLVLTTNLPKMKAIFTGYILKKQTN